MPDVAPLSATAWQLLDEEQQAAWEAGRQYGWWKRGEMDADALTDHLLACLSNRLGGHINFVTQGNEWVPILVSESVRAAMRMTFPDVAKDSVSEEEKRV